MTEIERKYLVKNNSYKVQAQKAGLIIQGYLGDNPLSETRIAIRENKGWIFIKAKGTLSRFEWRQEIPHTAPCGLRYPQIPTVYMV